MRLLALATLPCVLAAGGGETVTTRKDRQALAVTIYNDNLALVKDQREVRLPKGDLDLAFAEVSAQIRPETALLRNLTEAKDFWINEQNFDFDLLTPAKLLEKYVGRRVTVVSQRPNPDGAGAREAREEAEVLATNNGVVLKFADRIETSVPGRIVFPGVPETLRARPTLVLNLHSPRERAQGLELSYLTGGLSWRADYVANLAPDEKTLDLSGWVTLTNQSGADYPDATLQLVAGDVHRAPVQARADMSMRFAAAPAAKAPAMAEESLFEYHLYTLDRPTTLKENQTKQVALLTAQGVPVRKEYVLRGDSYWFTSRREDVADRLKVAVFMEFENREAARMGMPLPKGVVRVYKRDSQGRPQFVGEDTIDHTPRNETIRLKLGDAFDVTATRRQTDFKSLGAQGAAKRVFEAAFQVDLKNAKKEAVAVNVLESLPGDWEIVTTSHEYKKENSGLARFCVTVPAEGSATLVYRARMRW
ncbi:DUF4139 domain-containing protein [Mesoterricola sediminis]|uniref:DUF4139 domain-containing protein n=1 Tax=Mesoterricola sediminis TaxID=2927980 RepID=A0AA48KBX1_9BACT|nr:DUF4139 domain-containing protein [Mesoterricola sediminis]BDU76341.1 DUF4139 domain-containing protein [Mesoterricola sediminis]